MRTIHRFLSLAASTSVMLAFGALMPVQAQEMTMAAPQAKPLMVIRFNQPHVYYDQQLYGAISQAVAVKPGVMFDVISNAPVTGDASRDAEWIRVASHNTQAVIASMQGMGVPMERMHVTGQQESGLHYDETQIFAR